MRSCLALLFLLPVLEGHHSTAFYDIENPVTITGTVKKFEWINPHSYIYLDVAGDEWKIEMMSVQHLKSFGWTRELVKPGDVIRCTGGVAKDGSHAMLSSKIRLKDGREIRS